MFRHGLQTQGTFPQISDWKTESDYCVKWILDIHSQKSIQKKRAEHKSVTSEYKKITDRSAYFGSLSVQI